MCHILHICKHSLWQYHDAVPVIHSRMKFLKEIEFDRLKCKHINLFVGQRSNKLLYLLDSCRIRSRIFDGLKQELKKIVSELLLSLSRLNTLFKINWDNDES